MRPILAFAFCALLTACATAGPRADKVTIQTVNVPVPVACASDPGAKPALADPQAFADAVARAPGVFQVAQTYAAAVQELFNYQARLEAANAGCRAPTKTEVK